MAGVCGGGSSRAIPNPPRPPQLHKPEKPLTLNLISEPALEALHSQDTLNPKTLNPDL